MALGTKFKSHLTFCIIIFSIVFCNLPEVTAQLEETFRCPAILSKINENRNLCDAIKCEKVIHEEQCPPDTIYSHNFSLCGCCPACVRYLDIWDNDNDCVSDESEATWALDPTCEPDDNHCAMEVNLCFPGLVCNQTEAPFRCHVPVSASSFNNLGECVYRKSLYRQKFRDNDDEGDDDDVRWHHWDPVCEADGSFAPKQCKGSHFSGECFCVQRDGQRIFGREWRNQAENQTCACSRKVAELRSQGFVGTYHCTPDGNFEPLQCDSDSGLCYCVDPQTGDLDGAVVPPQNWKHLPCYSLNITNGSTDGMYLRKCESTYAATKLLEIENRLHGTKVDLRPPECDYDGSFKPVLKLGSSSRNECVFKNGTRILNFMSSRENMLCNCARDVYEYFPFHKRPRPWDCQLESGDYDVAYDFGSNSSCVDPDGFLYGDVTESTNICCLLSEPCFRDAEEKCSRGDIMPCAFWPFRN